MKAIRLTLLLGAVLVSTNPVFPHFVKAALGFRLGYSPAEKGYGEKLTLNSAGKKGVGVQLLSGVNNGGWQGAQGELKAAGSNTVGDTKTAGSAYGVGISTAPAAQGVGQARSIGGGGPLEALGGAHGAVRHLRILGLNLYLGGRAAALGQGLGLIQKQQGGAKKPLLGGILAGGQQPQGSNLITGHSPLAVLSKPISVGAGIGGKSNLLTNLGPAPNGGKNIGGLHGLRIAAGTPGFGLGLNLGLRHGVNSKSPLGLAFGLGNSGVGGGPQQGKYAIGKIPFVYSGSKGQDQAYIPGSGILKGHGHDNNLAYSPNSIEGLESKPQIILAQAPLQLSVIPLQGAATQAAQVIPQAQPSQQHHQQAAAPQQHQGLQGPLSIPSTYRNPFLSFLRPSILRPSPLQYTFNHPQAQPTGPIRQSHLHHPHHHPRHPQAPQRPRSVHHNESPSLFSGWSTLFPLGRHKTAPSNANNYFVNPLLPNGQPLAKLQASLRPGQNSPLATPQRQVPFIQQAQRQQHPQQQQPQQQYRGFHPQYTSGFQNLFGVQPHQNHQQFYNPGAYQQQRPGTQASPAAASNPSTATQQHNDYNFFQQLPFQNFQSAFSVPQASPFLTGGAIQPSQIAASPLPGTHNQYKPEISYSPTSPFTADSTPFAPPPGFQYSHSTHSQPVKMGSFTMDIDLSNRGQVNSAEQGANSNAAPLYGPLGRRLKKTKSPKTKTRTTDVIIKKKDDFFQETNHPNQNYNPFQDMETSASTNAFNALNSMTLSSSLGETSWTPIIHVAIPSLARKSIDQSPVSPKPSMQTTTIIGTPMRSEKRIKSLPLSNESTQKEAPKSLQTPSPTTTTTAAKDTASQDRSMIFRRRKLNVSGEQSREYSSTTSAATSPSTIVQLPLVSPSTSTIIRTSPPSTTVRPPSTPASSSPSSSSLAPSTSSLRPSSSSTTTTVSSLPSSSSSSPSTQAESSQTSSPVTTDSSA